MTSSIHSYLGDLESVFSSHSGIHEDGKCMKIPLIYLENVVLFPGDELPLRTLSDIDIDMIRHRFANEHALLGAICYNPEDSRKSIFGTTVQIEKFNFRDSILSFTGKAKQRFQLKRIINENFDYPDVGDVMILADIPSPSLPFSAPYHSKSISQRSIIYQSSESNRRAKCHRIFLSHWDWHVFKMYNAVDLLYRIQSLILSNSHCNWFQSIATSESHNDNPTFTDYLVQSPLQQDTFRFAYWLAANLPINTVHRLQLLEINDNVRLLQKELTILYALLRQSEGKNDVMKCVCDKIICYTSDIFCMSSVSTGGTATFVNPGGIVHQILTLRKVEENAILLDVNRHEADSWFTGYSWTIVHCKTCYSHLGWQFNVIDESEGLVPTMFYGFRRSALYQAQLDET